MKNLITAFIAAILAISFFLLPDLCPNLVADSYCVGRVGSTICKMYSNSEHLPCYHWNATHYLFILLGCGCLVFMIAHIMFYLSKEGDKYFN